RPRRPEEEAAAKQATDYLNWVFQSQPDAFTLLHTWIKSALLSRLGVVKSWWDDAREVMTESYEGLTRFQYLTLLSDENVEPVSVETESAPPVETDPAVPIQARGPANPLDDGLLYRVTIKRTNKTGRIAIAAIPPEEFLTD